MLWLVAVAFVLGALGIYRLRASSTPSRPIVQRIRNKPTKTSVCFSHHFTPFKFFIQTAKTGKTYLVTGGHGVLGTLN